MHTALRSWLPTLVLIPTLLLAACGGGGSSGGGTTPPTPPTPTNTAPVARIAATASVPVGTVVTLDGTTSSDAEGNALTYAWSLTSVPTGSAATLTAGTTSRPSLTPDVAGNYSVSLIVNDGSLASTPASVVQVATAATPPTITLDKAEPLSGTVQLSLSGTVSGAVSWYVDLALLGNGSGSNNALNWNTTTVSNASHLVVARIQTAPGAYQDVRRTITVSNSSVTLSAAASGTSGSIFVDARASSTYGITRVTGTFDSGATVTLASPNACSRFCTGSNDIYRFVVDAATAGSGYHSMLVTASDASGSSQSLTVPVPVSNAPTVTVLSPADGSFAFGSLGVVGTASTDKTGGLTLTAKLGDVTFLNTTQTSFGTSFDLAGVAAGSYTLTVTATDATGLATSVTRQILVTSSAALAYSSRFTLPAGAQLMAADGTQVLYSTADGARVRDLLSGSEITLANAGSISSATDWQLSGGRAYVQGKGSDCIITCIYQWDATGAVLNLSNANPYSATGSVSGGRSYDLHPVARNGYVLWVNWAGTNPGGYTLYDVAANSYRQILAPAGFNYIGNISYDFALVGGVVHFYGWGQTGGDGTASTFDLFKWKSDTGTSVRLTSDSRRNIYPQTDGVRVAWQASPIGGNADGSVTLLTQPLAGGSSSSVSATATSQFLLRDGVLAWVEGSNNTKAVKAATVSQTTTLAAISTAVLQATGGGQVIYSQGGKLYNWNSVTGTSTLRLETAPGTVLVAGGALIFNMGSSVYRVTLN